MEVMSDVLENPTRTFMPEKKPHRYFSSHITCPNITELVSRNRTYNIPTNTEKSTLNRLL